MTDAELLQNCHSVFPGHRVRTPAQMFAAMAAWCEQHDVAHDVYGSGALIEAFERKVAALLGFEAAVFCISGTMAQVTALRLACEDHASTLVALGGIYANLAALQFHSVHVTPHTMTPHAAAQQAAQQAVQ